MGKYSNGAMIFVIQTYIFIIECELPHAVWFIDIFEILLPKI